MVVGCSSNSRHGKPLTHKSFNDVEPTAVLIGEVVLSLQNPFLLALGTGNLQSSSVGIV
jgi:hypothetical protein